MQRITDKGADFSEKSYLYYGILTSTKLKYFMSYTIKLHCQRGDVLSGEQEIVTKEFLERFHIHQYMENVNERMNFL